MNIVGSWDSGSRLVLDLNFLDGYQQASCILAATLYWQTYWYRTDTNFCFVTSKKAVDKIVMVN